MTRHVALLRAVNVGGRGKIAMADLRKVAEAIGFEEAQTVLQSGSLIFSAGGTGAALESCLENALAERFGLRTFVITRSAAQWHDIVAGNPFPAEARSDPSHLLALVAKGIVAPGAEAAVNATIKGRERVAMGHGIAYAFYTDGIGRSKLTTDVLERGLGTPVTGRNWNTVLKIDDLLGVSAGLSA